ncbi:MAG: hypothetical protein IIW86_00915, partial [Clostridia bacterium]|nr:hypothetical protein [Clostridia bacterium]
MFTVHTKLAVDVGAFCLQNTAKAEGFRCFYKKKVTILADFWFKLSLQKTLFYIEKRLIIVDKKRFLRYTKSAQNYL